MVKYADSTLARYADQVQQRKAKINALKRARGDHGLEIRQEYAALLDLLTDQYYIKAVVTANIAEADKIRRELDNEGKTL